jgi:hypothetical protein
VKKTGMRTIPRAGTPACGEAVSRLRALLEASRELEMIQAQRGADEQLLQRACQKKQRAAEELIAHTLHHHCLPYD